MGARARKIRKTFTLSSESISDLKAIEKDRHSNSSSAVLEELLLEKRREHARAGADASIARYYDRLSAEEEKENEAWAEIAESQFPLE